MLSSLPLSLLSLLTTSLLLLSASQVTTALAFSTPEQFGYYERNFFVRQMTDLQTFNGKKGASAPPITNSGDSKRPFKVNGDTFTDFKSAAQRTCDTQFDGCQKAANGQGNKGNLKVSDCEDQKSQCNSAQSSAKVQSFGGNQQTQTQNIGPDPQFPDFDLICEV